MLISYNWLRELSGTKSAPLDLRERLTMVGLAIDAIQKIEEDAVLDVEVPSNRPDCLSHVGIAREVSVIEKSKVQTPESKTPNTGGRMSHLTSVEILDPDLCPRYSARIVRGVKIAPSPEWLAKRLTEIGQRPINNVADITNYVLHEMGQPLHAFDLARLSEHKIVVRRARASERLTTLDGMTRQLNDQMLVIADAQHPVALAGIMGGQDSEISNQTTDVLIESAYFGPDSVRRTARQLGMDTEASRRFERGADRENILMAQERCVALICEIAGGVATEDVIDVYPRPQPAVAIDFRPERVESLTSLRIEAGEMIRILSALGFTLTESTPRAMKFLVPTWRVDVSLEEDLVEEIARHSGYDQIRSELPPSQMSGEYQPTAMKRRALRRVFADLGFDEAINFSFIDNTYDDQFDTVPALSDQAANGRLIALDNPITDETIRMRPTLLPGMLTSLRHNVNHGTRDVRLFEIGRVFAGSQAGELPVERDALALLATGSHIQEGRAQAGSEIDFFDLKGALEAGVDGMNLSPIKFHPESFRHLRNGQSAKVSLSNGTELGNIGRLAESIGSSFRFRQPVYVAELDLTALLESEQRTIQYKTLPRFPSVVRDVTLLVSRDVSLNDLLSAIETHAPVDYSKAKLVGTYEGNNIPQGKRSITLRIEYRSEDRTLRDDEVEDRHRELIDSLLKEFAAELH